MCGWNIQGSYTLVRFVKPVWKVDTDQPPEPVVIPFTKRSKAALQPTQRFPWLNNIEFWREILNIVLKDIYVLLKKTFHFPKI